MTLRYIRLLFSHHLTCCLFQESPIRPIILYANIVTTTAWLCNFYEQHGHVWGRYVWILPVVDAAALNGNLKKECGFAFYGDVVVFNLVQGALQVGMGTCFNM